MKRTSNAKSDKYTKNQKEFKGSNLFAVWKGPYYVVYSFGYHFPLYVYNSKNEKWYENINNYSRTTEKHRFQSRPTHDTIKMDTVQLHYMIQEEKYLKDFWGVESTIDSLWRDESW